MALCVKGGFKLYTCVVAVVVTMLRAGLDCEVLLTPGISLRNVWRSPAKPESYSPFHGYSTWCSKTFGGVRAMRSRLVRPNCKHFQKTYHQIPQPRSPGTEVPLSSTTARIAGSQDAHLCCCYLLSAKNLWVLEVRVRTGITM